MALVLIKEDGTRKADANSYGSVADADAYHEAHLYAAEWIAATAAMRTAALVMATRLIDAVIRFRGLKASKAQALQWPRNEAINDDVGQAFSVDEVPQVVIAATCETARELIKLNRTSDPEGEGLKSLALTGTMSVTFDVSDRRPMLPPVARVLLARVGDYREARFSQAKLVRV